MRSIVDDLFELAYQGSRLAGVDEVGRGPLAGDVVAAAVILDPVRPITGLRDSKKLSESRREELAILIRENALAWSVARASVAQAKKINGVETPRVQTRSFRRLAMCVSS